MVPLNSYLDLMLYAYNEDSDYKKFLRLRLAKEWPELSFAIQRVLDVHYRNEMADGDRG